MGKYIPFKEVNLSCLCDVDYGKDLALILIVNVGNMTIQQIAQYLNQRATDIKAKKDKLHKK